MADGDEDLPDGSIVDWETVKTALSLDDDDQEKIEQLIRAASATMETLIGGFIVARPKTMILDGSGRATLLMQDYPIQSIDSVFVDPARVFGPDSSISDFVILAAEGELYRDAGWPRGIATVKVQGTFGWDPVPDDLKDACIRLVAKARTEFSQERLGVKSFSDAGGVKWDFETGIPLDVYRLLQIYRKAAV